MCWGGLLLSARDYLFLARCFFLFKLQEVNDFLLISFSFKNQYNEIMYITVHFHTNLIQVQLHFYFLKRNKCILILDG